MLKFNCCFLNLLADVAQRIEQSPPKRPMKVRLLPSAQKGLVRSVYSTPGKLSKDRKDDFCLTKLKLIVVFPRGKEKHGYLRMVLNKR